ncbi:hypothetical protein ES705_25330 [subsurface metagenome]
MDNSIQINEPDYLERDIIIEILKNIWKNKSLSELRKKIGNRKYYKHLNYLLEARIIRKDELSLSLREQFFVLNFGEKLIGDFNGLTLNFEVSGKHQDLGKLQKKLKSLRKTDFKALNGNYKIHIWNENERHFIDLYFDLGKYNYSRKVAILKNLRYYIVKAFESKDIEIVPQKHEKSKSTVVSTVPTKMRESFDIFKFNADKNALDNYFLDIGISIEKGYDISNALIDGLVRLGYINRGNEIRFHRYYWILGYNGVSENIRNYVYNVATIKGSNFSIARLNNGQVQISISSYKNHELYNSELWNKGFEQIRERLKEIGISSLDINWLVKKLNISNPIVEYGYPILMSRKEIRRVVIINKHYMGVKRYNFEWWVDTSPSKFNDNNPFELDIRTETDINYLKDFLDIDDNIVDANDIVMIERFDITASKPEITRFRNAITNFGKDIYEINDLSILVIYKVIQYHYRTVKDS